MNELVLALPDGTRLRAVRIHGGDYPCIQIFLDAGECSELICFAEYNPDRYEPHCVCVGAYQSHQEDTTYYEPYYGGIDNESD